MALQQIEYYQEDPRIRYELVDGDWYPYTGPAGDVNKPVPCEEVDGDWYPYAEEGAPVVQGALHGSTIADLRNMVTGLLLNWPEVGIFSDVYLFWQQRQAKKYAPDLYVLPRVNQQEKPRQSVHQWKEPSKTVFVLEVLSDSNDDEDPDEIFQVYQNQAKINEYLICEPRTSPATVWGYRLQGGVYVPIEPDERGRIWSDELRGWFGVNEAGQVQVWNEAETPMPRIEEALRQLEEQTRLARIEAQRAEEEFLRAEEQTRRAEALELQNRELKEELIRLRNGSKNP